MTMFRVQLDGSGLWDNSALAESVTVAINSKYKQEATHVSTMFLAHV